MSKSWQISRRTALKGLGTALALPLLDAMRPGLMLAAEGTPAATTAAPLRAAFLYVPNGVNMQHWTPATTGADYVLPSILEPLAELKSDFSVLSGLDQLKAAANGDGAGDHARALATFLTGTQARKTDGADIRAGVSVDQLAAKHLGRVTRFPSLEIGVDIGARSGNCDSGYSCAYSSSMAWKSETQPLTKDNDPKQVFERLFAQGQPDETAAARAKRELYNKSILDFVMDDAQRLKKQLGGNDQRKMDEYLTAVRELEVRISRADRMPAAATAAEFKKPTGIPASNEEHLRILGDLMVLAFQGDVTRVCTYIFANEGSNKSYPFIDVPEGHHELSHHQKNSDKLAKIAKINTFHIRQLAYILQKMKATQEGEGNLLDNSMLVYGSGIGDGDAHNHDNLPILLAGKGGGTIKQGRHMKFDDRRPLTNLYLSMLDRLGVPTVEHLGDSSGRLTGLDV